jgi:hypothetical protein
MQLADLRCTVKSSWKEKVSTLNFPFTPTFDHDYGLEVSFKVYDSNNLLNSFIFPVEFNLSFQVKLSLITIG